MKIAFVGKGGSGKTTTSSVFVRHLGTLGLPVIAIDADINQHLGTALGLSEEEAARIPALGANIHRLKEYLRGNKVENADDEVFLRDAVGDDLLVCLSPSSYVRACKKGREPDFATLEPHNRAALDVVLKAVNDTPQDWAKFTRQGAEFHIRNAKAWGNDRAGEDLAQQINPDFVMGLDVSV